MVSIFTALFFPAIIVGYTAGAGIFPGSCSDWCSGSCSGGGSNCSSLICGWYSSI